MTVTALAGGWVSIIDENLEKPGLSEKHLFRVADVVRVEHEPGYTLALPDGTKAVGSPVTRIFFRTAPAILTVASFEDVYAAVRDGFLPSP